MFASYIVGIIRHLPEMDEILGDIFVLTIN